MLKFHVAVELDTSYHQGLPNYLQEVASKLD